MQVFCMYAPELCDALKAKESWALGLYLEPYSVDFQHGMFFGLDNPQYALEDFKFNEYKDWQAIREKYGVSMTKIKVKVLEWNPKFN